MTEIDTYRLKDIAVAIIDDHEAVLEGFRSFLVKNGIKEVEAFSKSRALLDRARQHPFDIYLVDVELPDMGASDLIDQIRAGQPDAKILINTMHEETWIVKKLTEKKVNGVLYKSGELTMLLDAIMAVINGQTYYCRKFRKTQERLKAQNDSLSDRELDVLHYIAKGFSTKEISTLLFISENTVENHRKSLFRKLQAHNMADLIVKALGAGYIDPKNVGNL